MNFRGRVDMLVLIHKTPLAHYVDNTMPQRRWSDYDTPSCLRISPRRLRPLAFGKVHSIRQQAG